MVLTHKNPGEQISDSEWNELIDLVGWYDSS